MKEESGYIHSVQRDTSICKEPGEGEGVQTAVSQLPHTRGAALVGYRDGSASRWFIQD